MLKRSIKAEWSKLQHSKIWAVLFVIPAIAMFFGSGNYWMNRQMLTKEWYSLWTQVVLFYGYFFFPVLISICCAYSCRLEHLHNNWNAVMTTPIPVSYVFISKLITMSGLTLLVQSFTCSVYLMLGKCFQFGSPIPLELIGWFLRGWVASVVIAALQLCFSMRIRSFAVPVGICMCGSVLGLGILVSGNGMFFPYSLPAIGMGAVTQEGLSFTDNILFFCMSIVFLIVFCLWGIERLKRKDVIT